MTAQLRFFGAAQEVTGSMHLVEVNGYTIALDCGLFQGRRAESNVKNRSFPCPANQIDAVVISHAHIDHCGRLPKLVKDGFKGKIHATAATCDLIDILLADSAHIQEEDAAYWNKKRVKKGDEPIEPLYDQEDAAQAVKFLKVEPMGRPFEVVPGVRATYFEAGHMLGSASILLEIDKGGGRKVSVTFSGDIGRNNLPILRDPAPLPECDYLICESTYGGRMTPDAGGTKDQFEQVLKEAIERGGRIIIPSFAVGRTQAIAYEFHQLVREGRIPDIPFVVDSPLAAKATEIYKRHVNIYDQEAAAFTRLAGDLFACTQCRYTESVEESKQLIHAQGPMIIVSASGMCEAGRILHHLKNNLESPKNTVLIVGFQAEHTLGRRLVEKAKQVKIFGEYYRVRAPVKVLNGFSSHANARELVEITAPLAMRCKHAFLVHGEPDQGEVLAANMKQHGFRRVTMPARNQVFPLD